MAQLTIAEWCKNEKRVEMAAKLLKSEEWRQMKEVLLSNPPALSIPHDLSAQYAGVALGMDRGWLKCLEAIEQLGTMGGKQIKPIPSTYGATQITDHGSK